MNPVTFMYCNLLVALYLLLVVTMDTKSTDTSSKQPVSSSGVGELL